MGPGVQDLRVGITQVRTVQVALPALVRQTNTQYGILTAGTVITPLPVYIVYTVLHRRMEHALLQGALKG